MLDQALRFPRVRSLDVETCVRSVCPDRDFPEITSRVLAGLARLAIATAVLLSSQVATASSFGHASVSRSGSTTPECFQTTTTSNHGIGTSCEIAGGAGFAPVSGVAFAHADGVGVLRTSAQLFSPDSDGGSWEAIGYAEGVDTLRITSAGLAGTQGVADFIFSTHTSDIRDAANLLGGTFGVISELQVKDDGDIRLIHSLSFPRTFPPFTARVFFEYGVPFELRVSLESKVSCTLCTGSWNGVSDATNTATLDIVNIQGLEQHQFVVESLLGNRYANVVPEPSTGLLMGMGLVVLGASGKRRGWRSTGSLRGQCRQRER